MCSLCSSRKGALGPWLCTPLGTIRSQSGKQELRGMVFGRCRDQGKGIVDKHDTGRFSPLNLSWSPGYTRLFYSNQNSCTHPWQIQDPGSPWQPSDPGRLEPTCTETENQVWGREASTIRKPSAHLAQDLLPKTRKKKETQMFFSFIFLSTTKL